MPIIAMSTGGPRVLMDSGNHVARCYRMVYMGTIMNEYKGVAKLMPKVQLSFEFPTQTHVFNEENGEQPFSLHKTYTLSLSEKSNLRPDLEAWRGKPFTPDELAGFDIEKVLGAPLMIQVGEKTKDEGDKINTILSMASVPKGIEVPAPVNPNFLFSVNDFDDLKFNLLPEWMQDEIKGSVEYKDLLQGNTKPSEGADNIDQTPASDPDADDLPF